MNSSSPVDPEEIQTAPSSAHRHWFEPVAAHMGEAYLRYSFTKGTEREVDALVEMAGLGSGQKILDVGCGPGRHALELGRRGHRVVGVDISESFIELAANAAVEQGLADVEFLVADARQLSFEGEFDLVISLCQGAFGLTAGPTALPAEPGCELDEAVVAGMARALKPGGLLVLSAFSAYFQLRFQESHDRFDADLGVNEEPTEIKNAVGEARQVKLWTTCYTPRELRLLARMVGLEPLAVHGVTPGAYGAARPSTETPEFLLIARRDDKATVEANLG